MPDTQAYIERRIKEIAQFIRGSTLDLDQLLDIYGHFRKCPSCGFWKGISAFKHRRATCTKCVNRQIRIFDTSQQKKNRPTM